MPKAKAAAMRALELNESLPEVHTTLGRIYFNFDWDWQSAEKEYKRGDRVEPALRNRSPMVRWVDVESWVEPMKPSKKTISGTAGSTLTNNQL